MKRVHDENLVKLVKENANYQVKTTSQDIINQYKFEMNNESEKKTNKKHKFAIAFGSILGTLAVAGAAASTVFIFNDDFFNKDNPQINFPDKNPETNNVLKKQLITFSAFSASLNDTNGIKNRILKKANLIDDEEDEENPNDTLDSELIKKSVDIYESVETSVNYLYHESNVKTETSEVKARFDKIDYTLVTKFYYLNNKEPFALYYFNDPIENEDDDEILRTSKAYYSSANQGYNVDVTEKIENEDDESEVETKLTLRDVHKVNKEVYVIEKENETENEDNQVSIENTLSFKTFESEDAYNSGHYSKKVSAETEVEGDKNEIEVKVKTASEKAKYRITKLSENNLELLTTFEEKTNLERNFEDEIINLEYKETGRIYTWNEFNWSFND